eukprot:13334688-Alexandrium_andersonii.AAC.1
MLGACTCLCRLRCQRVAGGVCTCVALQGCQTQGSPISCAYLVDRAADACAPAPGVRMFGHAACGLRRLAPIRPRWGEAPAPVRLRSGCAPVRHSS